MNADCSAGNHQGSGPFCTRCGYRTTGDHIAQQPSPKSSTVKKILLGCGSAITLLVLLGIVGALTDNSDLEVLVATATPTETPTPDGIPYTLEDGYAAALAAYLKLADQPGGDEISSCILASFIIAEYPTIQTAEDLDRMAYSLAVREEFRGLNVTAVLIATSLDFCVSYLQQEGWLK